MHGLIPRHRRKAGSGPPAIALIAWIGTDPHLRSATAAASHRRDTDPPLPANARTAKAAVAVCFVLACGVVLGITSAINDGQVVPLGPRQSRPPAVLGQSPVGGIGPETSSVPLEQGGPGLLDSPAPVAIEPMIVNRQTPQASAVPGANGDRTISPRRTAARSDNPGKPTDTAKPDNVKPDSVKPDTAKPSGTGASAGTGTPASSGPPGETGEPGEPEAPGRTPGPAISGPPVSPGAAGDADKPIVLSKPTESRKVPRLSNPGNPGTVGASQYPAGAGGGGQQEPKSTGKSIGSPGASDAGIRDNSGNMTAGKPAPSNHTSGARQTSPSAEGSTAAGKSTPTGGSAGRGSKQTSSRSSLSAR